MQQGTADIQSVYGQAGCTQDDPSFDLGTTSLSDILHTIIVTAIAFSSNHYVLPANKSPRKVEEKQIKPSMCCFSLENSAGVMFRFSPEKPFTNL